MVRILFTHDIHERIDEFKVYRDGKISSLGGFKRLDKLITDYRTDNSLLLDAGDFSMGTLYHTIFTQEMPALSLMSKLGYDGVTLGNHDFEFGSKALAQGLNSSRGKNDYQPKILLANIDLEDSRNVDDFEFVRESFLGAGLKDYEIFERDGLRIGVFGIIGYEAIEFAPMANINFQDPLVRAREVVARLREEKVDMIIALSHSGTKTKGRSEDEILAKKVEGIDLIISGHTHRRLSKPLLVDKTIIVSCGRYGERLGLIDLDWHEGHWRVLDYDLLPVDSRLEESDRLDQEISRLRTRVNRTYLEEFGLSFDQRLASLDFNFTPSWKFGLEYGEDCLANLVTDSYIEAVKDLEGDLYEKIDLAIIPAGEIRDSFVRGDISVSQVFNVASLGRGYDGFPGYPLVTAYISGRDIKKVVELDASIGNRLKVAQLFMSGISYKVNPRANFFNRAYDIRFIDHSPIDNKKNYRVVASLYTAQMLDFIRKLSRGSFKLSLRDKKGEPIEDLRTALIYDDDRELKQWYALAYNIKKLGYIPNSYRNREGRKLIVEDRSLISRFKNSHKLFKYIYSLLGIILVITIIKFLRS